MKTGIVPVETRTFSYENGGTEEKIWPSKMYLLNVLYSVFSYLGGIPSDGVPEIVIVTVAVPLTVIYCILSVLGICFAAVCLVFNFMYREKK